MVSETDGKKSVAHVMSDSHPMAYCMVPPPRPAATNENSLRSCAQIKAKDLAQSKHLISRR